jgi:hypothetical protein
MTPSPLAGVDLHDIIAAPPPAFWPPAPGWWIVALLVLGAVTLLGWRLLTLWRRRRHQARILAELESLPTDAPEQLATQVSILLRRVALMCFARPEVAPLSGDAWLVFLDRTGGNGEFVHGVGQVLATAPYAAAPARNSDDESNISNNKAIYKANNEALIALARQWIKHNLGQSDGRHK